MTSSGVRTNHNRLNRNKQLLTDEIQSLRRENFQLRSLANQAKQLRDDLDESTSRLQLDDWSTMSTSVIVDNLQTKSKQLIELKSQFKSIEIERNQLQTELTTIKQKLASKEQSIKLLKEKLNDTNQELVNQSFENQSNQQELDLLKSTISDLNDENNQLRRQSKLIRSELTESRRCSQFIDCEQVNYDAISVNSDYCETLTPDLELDQLEDQIRRKTKLALNKSGQGRSGSGPSPGPSPGLGNGPRPLSELLSEIRESASMRLKSIRSNSVASESGTSYRSTLTHQVNGLVDVQC